MNGDHSDNGDKRRNAARIQLGLIAVVFFGPLLFATWLYFSGSALQPKGRTNNGALLEPVLSLKGRLPDSALFATQDHKWILLYSDLNPCDTACKGELYKLRQSRLMIGQDMDRLQRVFLHGDSPPDTLFIQEQHAGLRLVQDSRLDELLTASRPATLPAGGFYLIDPLGNLVMYFQPDIDPRDMVADIKHLLKLSHIG